MYSGASILRSKKSPRQIRDNGKREVVWGGSRLNSQPIVVLEWAVIYGVGMTGGIPLWKLNKKKNVKISAENHQNGGKER